MPLRRTELRLPPTPAQGVADRDGLRDELVAKLHDLRDELGPLRRAARELADYGWSDETLRTLGADVASTIDALSSRLDSALTRLRDGVVSAGTTPADGRVDLVEVVHRVAELLGDSACQLTVHPRGPVRGHWDRGLLLEAVHALVINVTQRNARRAAFISLWNGDSDAYLRLETVHWPNGVATAGPEHPSTEARSPAEATDLGATAELVSKLGGALVAEDHGGGRVTFNVRLPLALGESTGKDKQSAA